MGKATRWFRGLLGMKKDREKTDGFNSSDQKEKKRWSFGKPMRESPVMATINPTSATWMRSYLSVTEKEHNMHAIAVAAATAAAADAAVAAAQAAVAVVRLTSLRRGTLFGGAKEIWAAVQIQTAFRAHLARKALRALRGLVKLQALVRGFLVRKRAAATLHSMQALIRAAVRSQRARRSFIKKNHFQPKIHHRESVESFDRETRSEFHSKRLSVSYESTANSYENSPKTVEIDTYKPRSRSRRIHTFPFDPRLPIPDHPNHQDSTWAFMGDGRKFSSTAHNTPRFASSSRHSMGPGPAKSLCGGTVFGAYSNHPSYMSSTQSSEAKLRSQSAPRPRRLSLNDIMASRSGVRMQKCCSEAQET